MLNTTLLFLMIIKLQLLCSNDSPYIHTIIYWLVIFSNIDLLFFNFVNYLVDLITIYSTKSILKFYLESSCNTPVLCFMGISQFDNRAFHSLWLSVSINSLILMAIIIQWFITSKNCFTVCHHSIGFNDFTVHVDLISREEFILFGL